MNNDSKILLDSLPSELAINTKVWGPPTWFFLHSMAMAYPKIIDENNSRHVKIKKKMYEFLNSLGSILPCPICGDSYEYYITQKDFEIWPNLKSREKLTLFLYNIHNKVNEKLGVPHCDIPTFKEVIKFYSRFIAGSPCIATTEKERQAKKLQGCKNTDFKQYKCIVNVLDTYNNLTEIPNRENFTNKKDNLNDNKFKLDFGHIILSLIIIILIIFIFIKVK